MRSPKGRPAIREGNDSSSKNDCEEMERGFKKDFDGPRCWMSLEWGKMTKEGKRMGDGGWYKAVLGHGPTASWLGNKSCAKTKNPEKRA